MHSDSCINDEALKLELIESPGSRQRESNSCNRFVTGRSPLRRLTIIAPRQHRRWIVSALARRAEYRDYEFCFERDESCTEMVVECAAGAFQQIKELRQKSSIRLVLLDAVEAIGNCRHEILTALENGWAKDVLYVGNLGLRTSEFLEGRPCDLLFDQTANYKDQGSGISRIRNRLLTISRGRHDLYHLGLASFVKDAITHPSRCAELALGKKRAVFAGRDGIDAVHLLLGSINCPAKDRNFLLHEIEAAGTRSLKASIDDLCCEFARLIDTMYRYIVVNSLNEIHQRAMRCISFKALFRYFCLTHLSNRTDLAFLRYPNCYLRVYESPIYRRHKFLDFGGVYGFEPIYPRTSDLCMSGSAYLQLDQKRMRAACESSSANDWGVCLKHGVYEILSALDD